MNKNVSNKFKKVTAGVCAVLMVGGAVPVQPIAEFFNTVMTASAEATYTFSDNIESVANTTLNGGVELAADITMTIHEGVTLTINGGITGNHTLTVTGGGTLIVNGTEGRVGEEGYPGDWVSGGYGGDGATGGTGFIGNLIVNGATVSVTGGAGGKGGNGGSSELECGGNGGDGGTGGTGKRHD